MQDKDQAYCQLNYRVNNQPEEAISANRLWNLLNRDTTHYYWEPEKVYLIGTSNYQFSELILRRSRKKDEQLNVKPGKRYEILTSELGRSDAAVVYKTLTLAPKKTTHADGSQSYLDDYHYKQKGRVSKVLGKISLAKIDKMKRLFYMLKEAEIAHLNMKYPVFMMDDKMFLVMSEAQGQTLSALIQKDISYQGFYLSLDQRLTLSLAILNAALEQVINRGIVHMDFKPTNLMMEWKGNTFVIRAIDYDEALKQGSPLTFGAFAGTSYFMSPEVWQNYDKPVNQVTSKSDVFSLGKILLELWGKQKPKITRDDQDFWLNYSQTTQFDDVFSGLPLPGLSQKNQDALKNLFKQMCAVDPAARITLVEAIDLLEAIQNQYLRDEATYLQSLEDQGMPHVMHLEDSVNKLLPEAEVLCEDKAFLLKVLYEIRKLQGGNALTQEQKHRINALVGELRGDLSDQDKRDQIGPLLKALYSENFCCKVFSQGLLKLGLGLFGMGACSLSVSALLVSFGASDDLAGILASLGIDISASGLAAVQTMANPEGTYASQIATVLYGAFTTFGWGFFGQMGAASLYGTSKLQYSENFHRFFAKEKQQQGSKILHDLIQKRMEQVPEQRPGTAEMGFLLNKDSRPRVFEIKENSLEREEKQTLEDEAQTPLNIKIA